MTDEYIDIVDEQGNPLGKTVLKSEAHKNGWFHNTTHLWVFNERSQILLAQRSLKKAIHPGLWDVSAAGHVDSGETLKHAAIRECYEELGLHFSEEELIPIGVYKHIGKYPELNMTDCEFHHCFIAKWEGEPKELELQKGEVDDAKWVKPEEFLDLLDKSSENFHFIASNSAYYKEVLKAIKMETGQT